MQRHSISYYLPVLNPDTLAMVGHLVDISQIGLLLDCATELVDGKEYHLLIETPAGVSGQASITFQARVKWCRMDRIQPNTYNVGFEITSIAPSNVAIIQSIADLYGAH